MACNVTINLGENKDANVELHVVPVYKCKVLFEKDGPIKLSVNFYLTNQLQPIYTYIILESNPNFNACDSGLYEAQWWNKSWDIADENLFDNEIVRSLINAIETNIDYHGRAQEEDVYYDECIIFHSIKWISITDTLRLTIDRRAMSWIDVKLCDDSRQQFVEQFNYLMDILPVVNQKIKICYDLVYKVDLIQ